MARLRNEPEGAAEFFEMLGRAIATWGRFESGLADDLKSLILMDETAKGLILSKPRGTISSQLEGLKECFRKVAWLKPRSEWADEFTDLALEVAQRRNFVAHGSFWGFKPGDPLVAVFDKYQIRKRGYSHSRVEFSIDDLVQLVMDADNLNTDLLSLTSVFSERG